MVEATLIATGTARKGIRKIIGEDNFQLVK
jgi:hypothetical protein